MHGTCWTKGDAFSCTVQARSSSHTALMAEDLTPCLPSQHPAWNGRFPPALADHNNGRAVRGWEGKFKFGICT